ncbi:MAG: ribosome small subunit-dependent GTPase A [Longimicrobiales bacterium]|nr:ribosome small subunit-dependent GTPase A [Longimicrobiales bacterium]
MSATLRGRLKQESRTGSRVVIGDRVRLEPAEVSSGEAAWVIAEVEPRRGEIVRRGVRDRHARVVAANLDRVFAVVAAVDPEPRLETVDRLLVIAEASRIEVHVVVNKLDLPGAEASTQCFLDLYPGIGYPTWAVSALRGDGLDELAEVVREGTSCLVGPSGVGKSSILNALDPTLGLATGELSRKVAQGRHTTSTARILSLRGGGRVADTPGFGDVGVWGVPAARLELCFPEFEPWLDACRFRGCTHLHEPGCAVREALAEGGIAPSRMESYARLHAEAHEMDRDPTRERRGRGG